MNHHIPILSRTLIAEFYRVNAMFFLVVTGFCFGFMRGAEHKALAGFFVSSPWLAMIPIGVWVAYLVKVIVYNKREVGFERNRFLYVMPLTNVSARILGCVSVAIGQLAPVIAYGLFLLAMSLKNEQFFVSTIIVMVLVVLTVISAYMLDRALTYPAKEDNTPAPIRKLDQLFAKPMAWIFVEGIVRSQPGMIYTTKFVACILIYGATQLYLFDEYDERLYLMAACIAFSANLALVYQYQNFEVVEMTMFRSLPISLTKRILSLIVTMAILCFPEISILATNLPNNLSVYSYLNAIVFGFSLLIAGYGALYFRSMDFDSFTRWIFFVSMGWLLMILFGIPIAVGAVVQAFIGIYIIKKLYYLYEHKPQP